jgi:hypothetical protein
VILDDKRTEVDDIGVLLQERNCRSVSANNGSGVENEYCSLDGMLVHLLIYKYNTRKNIRSRLSRCREALLV